MKIRHWQVLENDNISVNTFRLFDFVILRERRFYESVGTLNTQTQVLTWQQLYEIRPHFMHYPLTNLFERSHSVYNSCTDQM